MNNLVVAIAAGLGVAACATSPGMADNAAPAAAAKATLANASGQTVGTATVSEGTDGLTVAIDAQGMAPGTHGIHVHTVGRCDAPDFASAGGHWNPEARQHGAMNPAGAHAGDIPNLTIGSDGTGRVTAQLRGGTVAGLFDSDGSAVVIHAGPDDLKTDPSGNSGGRIACGVLVRG